MLLWWIGAIWQTSKDRRLERTMTYPSTEQPPSQPKNQTGLQVVAILGVAAAIVFGLIAYLDNRIEARITDSRYMLELSRKARPSVIFDVNETVLTDLGAMSIIDRITVRMDTVPHLVTISPNEFLAAEPLLESLDKAFRIEASRGKKFDWVFRLYPYPTYTALAQRGPDPPSPRARRFRLELFR